MQDLAAEKRLAKPESSFGYSDSRERKGPGRKGMKRTASDLRTYSFLEDYLSLSLSLSRSFILSTDLSI
jgi:hypothetical protein